MVDRSKPYVLFVEPVDDFLEAVRGPLKVRYAATIANNLDGHQTFWKWLPMTYGNTDADGRVFCRWDMQVAFKAGWQQALAQHQAPQQGEQHE